jgi:hypothetical protein
VRFSFHTLTRALIGNNPGKIWKIPRGSPGPSPLSKLPKRSGFGL